jgi:hypothetical protein
MIWHKILSDSYLQRSRGTLTSNVQQTPKTAKQKNSGVQQKHCCSFSNFENILLGMITTLQKPPFLLHHCKHLLQWLSSRKYLGLTTFISLPSTFASTPFPIMALKFSRFGMSTLFSFTFLIIPTAIGILRTLF